MTGELAKALAQVQAALPIVHKGKKATVPMKGGGSYAYTYADLSDVTAAIMPLLAKHGIAFSCAPRLSGNGHYELVAHLMHSSGDSVTGALPINGATPQQIGSAITYARRYLLGSMTGVVTDDDDDARLATEAAKQARAEVHRQQAEESAPRITAAQSTKLHTLLAKVGLDKDRSDSRTGEMVPAREAKLKLASWSAGREITSTKELTRREADALIDHLATRAADMQQGDEQEKGQSA